MSSFDELLARSRVLANLDIPAIRAAWATPPGVIGTHWDGCATAHYRCAIELLCDRVEAQRGAVLRVEELRAIVIVAVEQLRKGAAPAEVAEMLERFLTHQ